MILLVVCSFVYALLLRQLNYIKKREIMTREFYVYGGNKVVDWLKKFYSVTKKYRKIFVLIDKQPDREVRNCLVELFQDDISSAAEIIDFMLTLLSIRNPAKIITLINKLLTIQSIHELIDFRISREFIRRKKNVIENLIVELDKLEGTEGLINEIREILTSAEIINEFAKVKNKEEIRTIININEGH